MMTTKREDEDNESVSSEGPLLEITPRERYVVTTELAQGGIGRILRANDGRLKRLVALKELLDPSPEAEERFVREALITARLQHPAIVPIYDAGRFPSGEAFYAMKLVSGRSLEDVIAEAGHFDKRLALLPHVIAVAEAVAYAHSEGIVHRDLKPANVLVGAFGETVVIDWGIAKDLRETRPASPKENQEINTSGPEAGQNGVSITMAGAVMGTPAYMPPEQAGGESVDERADVYALGAILYHLLAGVAPYEGKNGLEVLSLVLSQEPIALSKRQAGVPRDLLAVVAKAMAREANARYPTANELAQDLRRFQTGQIVGAHHYSTKERIIRFVQKYRAAVSVAIVALVVTVATASASLSRVLDARAIAERERDRATAKQKEAEEARLNTTKRSDELILLEAAAAAQRDPNKAIGWLGSLSPLFERWGEARLIAAEAEAYGIAKILRGHEGSISSVAYSPDGKTITTASDDRTVGVWSPEGKLLHKLRGHTDEVWFVEYAKDSKKVATASKDGTVRIWDLQTTASEVVRLAGPEAYGIHFLPGGTSILVASCASKHVEIHDIKTGAVETLPQEIQCPLNVAMSGDGSHVAFVSHGYLVVTELKTKRVLTFKDDAQKCLFGSIAPDARYVACYSLGSHVSLWETATGRQIPLPGHEGSTLANDLRAAEFSHDGKSFAWSHVRGGLRVLDLETGAIRGSWTDHRGNVYYCAFSPDDRWIATVSTDHTAGLREISGNGHRVYHGFHDQTSWVTFSPDQRHVVVSSWDHTARIFPFGASRDRVIAREAEPIQMANFSADGHSILSVAGGAALRVDAIDEKNTQHLQLGGRIVAISKDRRLLAFADEKGEPHLRNPESKEDLFVLPSQDGPLQSLLISPNNETLATLSTKGLLRLWDLKSRVGRVLQEVLQENEATEDNVLTFSSDGATLARAGKSGFIWLFRTSGGEPRKLLGQIGEVFALAFTPDGKQLISGGHDHTLRIFSIASGEHSSIDASGLGIRVIRVGSDNKSVFSLGTEAGVRHFDIQTGKLVQVLRGHETLASQIDVSPDGSRLVTASDDGVIRLWNIASGESRILEGHRGPLTQLVFSGDGKQILSAGVDGTVRIWYDDLPTAPSELRAWISAATEGDMEALPDQK